MRLFDILSFIEHRGSNGASLDEIKANFSNDNDELEEIKRLIQSGLDLNELHKNGKARGVRYYSIKYPIIQICGNELSTKVNDNKFIDGAIDVSKCVSTKEKIKIVLESTHPLSKPISLTYRESLLEKFSNRELRDFCSDGMVDTDVRIIYDNLKKKNYIYSQKEKIHYNSIWFGKIEGTLTIKKMYGGSEHLPEVKEFVNWEEFEKHLRTLLSGNKK